MCMSLDGIKNCESRVWQVLRDICNGWKCGLVTPSRGQTVSLVPPKELKLKIADRLEGMRVLSKLIERGLAEEDVDAVINNPAIVQRVSRPTDKGKSLCKELSVMDGENQEDAFVGRFHPYLQ